MQTDGRMKSRAVFAVAVLSSALISGGWFVERGLVGVAGARGSSGTGVSGSRLFDQVRQHIARDYVDTLSDSVLYVRSVDGLLDELHDPHSVYLTPTRLARLSESTTGRYAGVGLQIDVRDGWITVVAPLPGGPAKDAGIQTADRVVEIDGKSTQGLTVEEAQRTLRGSPGSTVRLTVERPGLEARLPFTVRRREIRIHPARHALLLGNGVGYVDLVVFSEEAADDLRRSIDSLRAAGMRKLILDLREDPGGLLDQGVAVADLFLDPGQRIVSMRGRTPDANREFRDRAPQAWRDMPIAVLVDSGSASASEIVAGALQDHDRAVLFGSSTYGKGSAQSVFPLSTGGALKLTTALWYTPAGRSINRRRDGGDANDVVADSSKARKPAFKTDGGRTVLGGGGITPDVQLTNAKIADSDLAFQRALGKHIPQFRDALTDYAISLKTTRAIDSPAFIVTPAMRAELLKRMQARGITIDRATYEAAAPLIDRVLGTEIARYSFGENAQFERQLRSDSTTAAALKVLAGASTQRDLIERAGRAPSEAPSKP
jgi:carboxyl-terminal processing protease